MQLTVYHYTNNLCTYTLHLFHVMLAIQPHSQHGCIDTMLCYDLFDSRYIFINITVIEQYTYVVCMIKSSVVVQYYIAIPGDILINQDFENH